MSDRTRGSRSRSAQDRQDYGRSPSHGAGGRGESRRDSRQDEWQDAWDEGDEAYGNGTPARSRYSAQGSQGRRSQRYDDYGYEPEDYAEPRPRTRSAVGDERAAAWNAGGARGAYSQREPERRRGGSRAPLLVLAGLLVVIALALVGILVVPGHAGKPNVVVPDDPYATVTPGATPTLDPNFKAYTSDRSHYAIVYPGAWNATSDQRTTQSEYDYIDTFALQNAPSRLLIEQAGAFSAYTDQQIIAAEVSNAQQNGVTFTKTDTQNGSNQTPAAQTPTATKTATASNQTQKVGGVTWTRQDYSVNANGNPVHMVFLACHHSGRGYVIVLVSTAAEFGNDDQAVFEPMLASFTFL